MFLATYFFNPSVSFHQRCIITPLLVLLESQADESLEPFNKATLSEGGDRGGSEKCIKQQQCGFRIIRGTITRKVLSSVTCWICALKFLPKY